ncbi:MAG: alpha/beta hydrolase [Acidobacteriota bacterium]
MSTRPEIRQLDLADVSVRLATLGAGSPVLMLHGNPDTGELWHEVAHRISDRYRCLMPDLPGFGGSRVTGRFDCSLESMVRWVDELVVASGVELPLSLVVHDFGGPYGISWAIRNPEKVRRIAILDSLYFEDYRWHPWARVWRTPGVGELSMWLMNRWIFTWELRRGGPRLPAQHIRETYRRLTPEMKRMVLQLYRATDPENFAGWERDMLALTSRVPTLVMWGAKDPYIRVRYAERWGTERVTVLPDCGHWLPVEAPDAVASKLLSFFESTTSQPNEGP